MFGRTFHPTQQNDDLYNNNNNNKEEAKFSSSPKLNFKCLRLIFEIIQLVFSTDIVSKAIVTSHKPLNEDILV